MLGCCFAHCSRQSWCITDHLGRQLNLGYAPSGALQSIHIPSGESILYEVDGPTALPGPTSASTGRITTVTYLDRKTIRYFYGEPSLLGPSMIAYAPDTPVKALTGKEDENGVRVGSYSYSSYGFANATTRPAGAGAQNILRV